MGNYFSKRLISLVPICFLLIASTFLLTRSVPGDVLDQMLMRSEGVSVSSVDYQYRKEKLAEKLGLNKPLFYFSVSSLAEANAFRYFNNPDETSTFYQLLNTYGDYKSVCNYYDAVKNVESGLLIVKDKQFYHAEINAALAQVRALKTSNNERDIQQHLQLLNNGLDKVAGFSDMPAFLNGRFNLMQRNENVWKKYIPVINFYPHNQFHSWFFGDTESRGVVAGNLGISYYTGKPVVTILKERIGWSLLLALTSVLLAYGTSIPLAAWLVFRNKKRLNSFFEIMVSVFYATPVYLLGVALLFLLSNPDVLNILPSSGVKPLGGFLLGTSIFEKAGITFSHLFLPLICYTYATFAFLLRTTKDLLEEQMKLGYVKTAYAKGLDPHKIVFKHALKNAVLPLAAVFTNVFPAILGGSVIIETLFSIPGIGLETFNAAVSRNYPVIAAVFMLTGILTLIGFILSDFITSRLDPRISFHKS